MAILLNIQKDRFIFRLRTCMIFCTPPLPLTRIASLMLQTTSIECFHSHGQHLSKFIGTKESVCIRKEFNSQRFSLGHQHGHCFIVLGHQHGHRDVMWKHSIHETSTISFISGYWKISPGGIYQGSKFKFEFGSTCATRCKFLSALLKFWAHNWKF